MHANPFDTALPYVCILNFPLFRYALREAQKLSEDQTCHPKSVLKRPRMTWTLRGADIPHSMRTDHYTPDTICQCLGLPGFEADPDVTSSSEAIRILLQPSFHPEVCVTFRSRPKESAVSVAAARAMVCHLLNPAPVLTDQDQGEIDIESFTSLPTAQAAACSSLEGTGIVLDGMPANALLMRDGEPLFKVRHNAGTPSAFSTFVAQAIKAAWGSLQSSPCRNALAHAAAYTGLDLPLDTEPPRKSTVELWSPAPKKIAESCWTR
jgi:hypothetical protein